MSGAPGYLVDLLAGWLSGWLESRRIPTPRHAAASERLGRGGPLADGGKYGVLCSECRLPDQAIELRNSLPLAASDAAARRPTPHALRHRLLGVWRSAGERRASSARALRGSSRGQTAEFSRRIKEIVQARAVVSVSVSLSRSLAFSLVVSLLLAPLPFVDLVHGRAWADPLRCLVVSWSRCRPSPPPRASVKSPPRLAPRPLRSTRNTHACARDPSALSFPLHDEGRLAASPVARARVRGVALVLVVAVVFFFKERHTAAASCHDAAAEHDAGQVPRCDVITITSRC